MTKETDVLDWIACVDRAPPRDRPILVSSGWCWERHDYVHWDEQVVSTVHLNGGAVMVHWIVEDPKWGQPGFAGWKLAAQGGYFSQRFTHWADPGGPPPAPYAATQVPCAERPDVGAMPVHASQESESHFTYETHEGPDGTPVTLRYLSRRDGTGKPRRA